MSLFKTLIGRRQFIAAGVASTCALTCKRIAGHVTGAALPATTAGASAAVNKAAGMLAGNRCPHLLSPLRIRNRVLKNRIVHSVSPTYLLQGPETYPTDAYRNHYSFKRDNGLNS